MVRAKLRAARKAAGFTQGQMAKWLGFKSKAHYCMLERGQRRVTVETALRISNILHKPIEELFDTLDVHAEQTSSDTQIVPLGSTGSI